MKKRFYLPGFLLFCALLLSSCSQQVFDHTYTISIDLQTFFKSDQVQIRIDNTEVFDKLISTDVTLGLSAQTTTELTDGYHSIRLVVNGKPLSGYTFNIRSNLYIGIKYEPQTVQYSMTYSNIPFKYG